MKVAVILASNFENAPFYKVYKSVFDKMENLDVEYIIWNRHMVNQFGEDNVISFDCEDEIDSGSVMKFLKYIRYAKFVKEKLKKGRYDKILFLGTYAWTVAFLSSYLKKKYKNRYWVDVRDYTFEKIHIYSMLQKRAIKNSYCTAISSSGFKTFLPEHDYLLIHNIDICNINKCKNSVKTEQPDGKIRISFIGTFGYMSFQEKMIDRLGNDDRFVLQFFGTSVEKAKAYCDEKNITNVIFEGRFPSEKTSYYYSKTDIINNLYGNDNLCVKTALSNKLYYSLALKMPILVCKNTEMEAVTKQAGNGFTFDFDDPYIGDKLFSWYKNFNSKNLDNCTILFDKFNSENENFYSKVEEYLNA